MPQFRTRTPTLPSSPHAAPARLRKRPFFWEPVPGADITWNPNNPVGTMPKSRAGAFLADQKVYVLGGNRPPLETCNTVKSFDVETHQSVSEDAMRLPYHWASMVAVRTPAGKIYAIGGSEHPRDCYQWGSAPVQSLWMKRDDAPELQREPAGALGPDGKIYLIGGRTEPGDTVVDMVQCFEPVGGAGLRLRR